MHFRYTLVFLSFCGIFFIPAIASENDAQKELDLNSIMAIAEKNSPLLTAIHSDLESLFYKRRQEGKTQNPSVYFDYGQRKAADESGAEYAVQIEQPVYFPGRKELKQLLVDNDSKIKEIQQIEAYNSIRLSSIKFAYRYLVAADKKNHVKERLKRLSLIENYIKARPFFTPQAKTDLFIIETKILALRKHFNDLELGAAKDYESLNLYLRQESIPNLKIPYFKTGVKFDRNELEKKAVSQNPSILAAKGELNKARTELRLANLEKYPDYSITSQIGEDKSGVANRFYDFGLKFRIPVWDQFQNKVASAETNMKSKQDRLTYQENLIQTSFNQAFLDYEQSKQNLKLYDLTQLDRIDRDLNFADLEFKRGRILLISYLELENQLHETHHAVLDAQISHLESLLNLLYITNEKDILGVMGNASQTFEYQPK
ncbi:TolC family protein [Leptospira venezuelensis]|uniref:TolC family protein n=1 Tax=Leptospira venezuelensis TaxID=1958811 RepID=UPI001F32233E|nr:TolC family protein [Leptospira venezuelensis]